MLIGRDIAGAMANGVSFVCANCEHFWWGVDRKLDGCKAVHDRKECGGPIRNLAFPEYAGPLAGKLTSFCFLTGERSTCAVSTKGGIVGATPAAIELLKSYSPFAVRPMFVTGQKLDVLK